MTTADSDRPTPVWLSDRWERKKAESAQRVLTAIELLKEERRTVTIRAIREKVTTVLGVPFSSNTIKRNEAAYALYVSSREPQRKHGGRDAGLRDLYAHTPAAERPRVHAKVARLRRESKDSLIARLIALERSVAMQAEVENRLREEIVRNSQRRGPAYPDRPKDGAATACEKGDEMKIEIATREFSFNGVRLPDPNPSMTVEQVRECYCLAYPEITTAAIEGPEAVGSKLVYRFVRAIGSKG